MSSTITRTGIWTAAAVLACSAGAASAQELYFVEYQFNSPKIKAIGVDGSNLRELFTIPNPTSNWLPSGLALNPATNTLFWSNSVSSAVRVLKSGVTGVPAASVLASAFGVSARGASLDALGRVYFTGTTSAPVVNSIRRVDPDGSNLTTVLVTGDTAAAGAPFVDAVNGHIYFPALRQIKRMDLDGTNIKTIVRGSSQPLAIAVDRAAGYIYWVDADTISDFVGRAKLDGTDFRVLVDFTPGTVASSGLVDLVIDKVNGKLYIARDSFNNERIYVCNLDGSDLQTFYASPAGLSPSGLEMSTGAIVQPLADCNANGIADDIDIANGTAVDCNNNGLPDSCEVDPCPSNAVLYNNGSDAANTQGRALGSISGFQIYQPFTVPAGGWRIGSIGIDGFTSNFVDGSGFTVSIFPDNAPPPATVHTTPNEAGVALAEITDFNLRFDTLNENWVDRPLDVELPEGLYWVRLRPNQLTTYSGSVNLGLVGVGLNSRFRAGLAGTLQTASRSVAIRFTEAAPTCLVDLDNDGIVGSSDLTQYISLWFGDLANATELARFGTTPPSPVGSADLTNYLSAWFAALANGGC